MLAMNPLFVLLFDIYQSFYLLDKFVRSTCLFKALAMNLMVYHI